ncbi:IS200/IS605 family transposase [Halocola ammonii]
MANTYHQIYVHSIYGVKYRSACIGEDWQDQLFHVIGNLINETGCQSVITNGVSDHVHSLFALSSKVSVAEVMKSVKAKSSKWINENGFLGSKFEWQKGYGVFSHSKNQLKDVYSYIQNQDEHHKKTNFRDEYLSFLKRYDVDFDEKYIFQELQ